jgi:hypothetical protein
MALRSACLGSDSASAGLALRAGGLVLGTADALTLTRLLVGLLYKVIRVVLVVMTISSLAACFFSRLARARDQSSPGVAGLILKPRSGPPPASICAQSRRCCKIKLVGRDDTTSMPSGRTGAAPIKFTKGEKAEERYVRSN